MKKTVRRIVLSFAAAMLAAIILGASACAPYSSKYNAIGLVTSNTGSKAYMTFMDFEGTKVFRLKVEPDSVIKCSGKVGTGSASVYYVVNEAKTELFKVQGDGASMSSSLELDLHGTVYMIVETNGLCQSGDFRFDVE